MGSPFPSYYASKRIGEFCIFGGVAYGALAHIIIFEREKHELFEAGLFFAPVLGAIVGATIAPIAYFLLRKRELTDCLPILGWVGIVATVLTSALPWQDPVSAALFGAPLSLGAHRADPESLDAPDLRPSRPVPADAAMIFGRPSKWGVARNAAARLLNP
jgi:hypothetical protein